MFVILYAGVYSSSTTRCLEELKQNFAKREKIKYGVNSHKSLSSKMKRIGRKKSYKTKFWYPNLMLHVLIVSYLNNWLPNLR